MEPDDDRDESTLMDVVWRIAWVAIAILAIVGVYAVLRASASQRASALMPEAATADFVEP